MQTTVAARVIAIIAVGGLLAGGWFGNASMVAVTFGVLLWLGVELLWFQLVTAHQIRNAEVDRRVTDRSDSVQALWEGRTYGVESVVALADGPLGFGMRAVAVDVADVYPHRFVVTRGNAREVRPAFSTSVSKQSDSGIRLRYRLKATEIGVAKFRGVSVRFTSPSSLFAVSAMLHRLDEYVVAPRVFQVNSVYPLLKQDNRLSPPGIHTHRRAGSGSELLEVRDYQPGDPPKAIAWKLTARRDQLMSKQFESEVPLRCTMFLDTSASTHLRADNPPVLQPFVRVASTLIESLTASRDPVGVVTFDATSFRVHKHSAARRTSLRTIRALTTAATDVPRIDRAATNISQLIRLGLALSEQMYSELYAMSDRAFGLQILPTLRLRRSRELRRYRMASILCAFYGATDYTLGELMYRDSAMVGWLQKFLLDHQWGLGESRSSLDLENIADPRKVANLTRLLRHAIARSRDQERFVIFADLLHVADHLSPLASAIRTAQAQGHRVSVVCAWDDREVADSRSSMRNEPAKATRRNARELFAETQSTFLNRRFQQLQREMARAQVRVVGVHEETVMQQVLVQLQMARPGRIAT